MKVLTNLINSRVPKKMPKKQKRMHSRIQQIFWSSLCSCFAEYFLEVAIWLGVVSEGSEVTIWPLISLIIYSKLSVCYSGMYDLLRGYLHYLQLRNLFNDKIICFNIFRNRTLTIMTPDTLWASRKIKNQWKNPLSF